MIPKRLYIKAVQKKILPIRNELPGVKDRLTKTLCLQNRLNIKKEKRPKKKKKTSYSETFCLVLIFNAFPQRIEYETKEPNLISEREH